MKFFITATDTDIGKTFITTSLLKAFLDANFNAIALKPVQTGCEIVDNKAIAPDLSEYQKVNPKNDFPPRYAFEFPASPHFSANLENERINMGELEIYVNKYAKNAEITLIEGAGGLFVPLNEDEIFLDFIKILQIPVILVCKNVLGSINHTLLNIEILRQNGIKIALLVVNFHDENDKIAKSNLEYLRSKFDGEIAVLPKFENENYEKASEFFANFVQNCSKNLQNSDEIIDLEFDKNHLWHPYTSALNPLQAYGVKFVKGNKIYTDNGVLIDGMSSWWCAALGYNRSELNAAANTQISRFSHIMFGGLTHAPAVNLGKKLLEMMSEFSHIFYCDSGSVSVEVALKMALQYQQNKNPQKTKILTVLGGYHGDTIGAMSVCDPINGMHFLFNGILAEQIFTPRPSCRFDEPFDDTDLMFEYVLDKFKKDEITILGYSIGSGLSARIADKFGIKRLILVSAYYNFKDLASSKIPFAPKFLVKYEIPTDKFLANFTAKNPNSQILLFHGKNDDLIEISNSQNLAKFLKPNDKFFELNCGNNDIFSNLEFYNFLTQQL